MLFRSARIHRDQAGSSGIWADSIGAAPATVGLLLTAPTCRRGVRSDPKSIGSRWISLDPPSRRSGRLGSTEIKPDPAGSGPTRSAPRPRRRHCYSEHPRVGGTSDPTQLDWIPRSRHFCCPGSRQRCTCTQLRESHRIFSDLGNSSRSAVKKRSEKFRFCSH